MPISVTCQACGQSFQLRDELAGRTVRCRCGRPVVVPDPTAGVLTGMLDDEMSKPYERPPQRETPEYVAPSNKQSSAPAPAGPAWGTLSADAATEMSDFARGTWVALRSIVGVMGLTYGMLMVGLGGLVGVYFFLLTWRMGWAGFAEFPWPFIMLVMIALTGLLLAVASVGVLIAKKKVGPKARFAAGMLAFLWVAQGGLEVVINVRLAAYEASSLADWNWDFWQPQLIHFAKRITWGIVPLLCYVWCLCRAKRDLDQ